MVYTTSSCPYCRKAKAWLDERQVSYEEKHVDSDQVAMAEMIKLGSRTVPTFAIDGELVQKGYEPSGQTLTRALADRGLGGETGK